MCRIDGAYGTDQATSPVSNRMPDEVVRFRRIPEFDNLELLHATYRTFSFARHAHETFALGVVERGVQAFHYRGETYTTPPGHLIVVNPGEMHTGFAASEAGYTYRMLYPSVSLMQQAAAEISGRSCLAPFFPQGVIHDQTLSHDIARLHRALEGPATCLEKETLLLCGLARLIERHGKISTSAASQWPGTICGRGRAGVPRHARGGQRLTHGTLRSRQP